MAVEKIEELDLTKVAARKQKSPHEGPKVEVIDETDKPADQEPGASSVSLQEADFPKR